jgi:excisionase family DNA binding protein
MSRGHKTRTPECGAFPASLTTGEAARLLSVEPDTVLKWIKRGKIAALRTPGGHHRIPATAVHALLGQTPQPGGVPCWQFFGSTEAPPDQCLACAYYRSLSAPAPKVLAISPRASILRRGEQGVVRARDAYEAATAIESLHPDCVVLDEDLPAPGWRDLARRLTADSRIRGARIYLATFERRAKPPGLAGVVVKPFRIADLG